MKHRPLIALLALSLFAACQETGDKRCAREAEEADRQCPKTIDESTRIDSIRYRKEGNKFCYFYSLKGQTDEELKAIVNSPDNKLRTLQSLTNAAEMRYYLEHSVTFEYIYCSQTTKERLGGRLPVKADSHKQAKRQKRHGGPSRFRVFAFEYPVTILSSLTLQDVRI